MTSNITPLASLHRTNSSSSSISSSHNASPGTPTTTTTTSSSGTTQHSHPLAQSYPPEEGSEADSSATTTTNSAAAPGTYVSNLPSRNHHNRTHSGSSPLPHGNSSSSNNLKTSQNASPITPLPSRVDPLAHFFSPASMPSAPSVPPEIHASVSSGDPSSADLLQQIDLYAHHALYSDILKLCQEQFHLQKSQVSLQIRLSHMLAKLALWDVEHVLMHVNQLPEQRSTDPWVMTFLRQWVREWIKIEKERLAGGARTAASATTVRFSPIREELWKMLKEASEYVHFKVYEMGSAYRASFQSTPGAGTAKPIKKSSIQSPVSPSESEQAHGFSLVQIMSHQRRHPLHLKRRLLEEEKHLALWRQREIYIMSMIVNLSLLKEDYAGALRMSDYLLKYCMELKNLHEENDKTREYAQKYDLVITNGLLASLFTVHGRILLQLGFKREAEATFNRISNLDDSESTHWIPLNKALMAFVSHKYEKCRGILVKERSILEEAIEKEQESSSADKPSRNALHLHAFHTETVNNISLCYYFEQNLQSAIENLEEYIRTQEHPGTALDVVTVSNLCNYYDIQSEVGSKHKKKIVRKLVMKYRLIDYPMHIYRL